MASVEHHHSRCFTYPQGQISVLPQILTLMAVFCTIMSFPIFDDERPFMCFVYESNGNRRDPECFALRLSSPEYYEEEDAQGWARSLHVAALFGIIAAGCGFVALALLSTATCFGLQPRRILCTMILQGVACFFSIFSLIAGASDVCEYAEEDLGVSDCSKDRTRTAEGACYMLVGCLFYIAALVMTIFYFRAAKDNADGEEEGGSGERRNRFFTYPQGEISVLPQIVALMAVFCSIMAFPIFDDQEGRAFMCFVYENAGSRQDPVCLSLRLSSANYYMNEDADGWAAAIRVAAIFGIISASCGFVAFALLSTATCFDLQPRRILSITILQAVAAFFALFSLIAGAADTCKIAKELGASDCSKSRTRIAEGSGYMIAACFLYIGAAAANVFYFLEARKRAGGRKKDDPTTTTPLSATVQSGAPPPTLAMLSEATRAPETVQEVPREQKVEVAADGAAQYAPAAASGSAQQAPPPQQQQEDAGSAYTPVSSVRQTPHPDPIESV